MKDREKKKELIERGIPKDFGIRSYQLYNQFQGDLEARDERLKEIYKEDYQALKQIAEARKKQIAKIREHISFLITAGFKVYFGTYTYDDEKRRKEMKPETMKKYVKRTMKEAEDYILNIDYGKENERLHFHTIEAYLPDAIKPEDMELKKDYADKVGFVYFEEIRADKKSLEKVSRYINKLTYHSIKVKQSYVSTKKGSDFQTYQTMIRQAKKTQRECLKEEGRYIGLLNAINSTPKARKCKELLEEKYCWIDWIKES